MSKPQAKSFLILSILSLLACAPQAAKTQDRALLIGIGNYQQTPPRRLEGPPNDLAAFKSALLGKLGFKEDQLRVLQDEKATKAAILKGLDELVAKTGPGDKVVLYYSGHGEEMPDKDGDEKRDDPGDDQDEALLAYDVAASDQDKSHWISDDELGERLAKLQGRKVLAVFDACHSGLVTRGGDMDFDYDDAKEPGWGKPKPSQRGGQTPTQPQTGIVDGGKDLDMAAFFAVASQQKAIDDTLSDPAKPHSVFTEVWTQGIVAGKADRNTDGQISYQELLEYARQGTEAYCQAHPKTKACKTQPSPILQIDTALLSHDVLSFGQAAPATPLKDTEAVLLNHGNAAGLRLAIEGGATLRPGQPVRYRVQAGREGRLLVFDLRQDGQLVPLYPPDPPQGYVPKICRQPPPAERIQAGQAVLIPPPPLPGCAPLEIVASEPPGPGKLVAVLVEDAAVLRGAGRVALDDRKSGFVETAAGVDWVKDLRERLDKPVPTPDGGNRAARWSVVGVDYTVARQF